MILNHSFPGADQFILMIGVNIQSEKGGQEEAWSTWGQCPVLGASGRPMLVSETDFQHR